MSISGIGEKYYQNNVTTMKSTNSKDKVQEYYEKLVSHEVTPKFAEAPERLRRLTINETRRIQTFPDDYVFCGANTSVYKQIGNVVPFNMAKAVAVAVSEFLNS